MGLEPSPPPELLPEIDHDDIHLVCWLAVVPSSSTVTAQLDGIAPADEP
jgi:hypothetical protein